MIIQDARVELPTGQLDIWVAVAAHVSPYQQEQAYQDLLSVQENEMFKALRYPEHRFDYLMGRALLRSVLGSYTGRKPADLQFERNDFGKPELSNVDDAPRFNLSLTDGVAILAVHADADIGADIEYHGHGRSMLEVADQYFSALEIADLKTLPSTDQKRGFFRYWTLKESLVKAKGEGMSVPLDSFSFRATKEAGASVHKAKLVNAPAHFIDDASQWDFRFFELGLDYTAAVSVSRPLHRICVRESIPLVGAMEVDSTEALFSNHHQDALSAAFC
ncbi:4'-phosphopantetheinyl transferase superfamily protein [Litorivivens sp.]|uniref:4'-phosphopantetheinyl transferase family protein n=1 Tax=Litorivivens sp. TaxID=2020868 RepID=UPI00356A87B7